MQAHPIFEITILDSRLNEWGLPKYQTQQSAGIDLMACLDEPLDILPQANAVLIPTGLAIHMNTQGVCSFILPRSGLGHKKGLVLGNGTGVIDADYKEQCFISVWNRNPASSGQVITISPGERIAQMVFLPIVRPEFKVVQTFSSQSERTGGFGSTGV
jgi:dUTP pyrophosphatase